MFKNPWFLFSMLVFLFMGSCVYMFTSSVGSVVPQEKVSLNEDSILYVELDGVIMDVEDLLSDLRTYGKEKHIKGVLLRINSPGGVVGPSQEIYSELLKIRKELEKPVVVSANAIMASGGYYAAVAADKIFVNPGTLMGSIGVIMEFANLSGLYDWAKVKRYSLTTGAFKATGTDTRAMREDEKQLLQTLLDDVYMQFKQAVAKGRNLSMDKVEPYADGRIFTGSQGVKLGFADKMGTYSDALKELGEMTELGENPKVFNPRKKEEFWMKVVGNAKSLFGFSSVSKKINQVLATDLIGKPLYLFPTYISTEE